MEGCKRAPCVRDAPGAARCPSRTRAPRSRCVHGASRRRQIWRVCSVAPEQDSQRRFAASVTVDEEILSVSPTTLIHPEEW